MSSIKCAHCGLVNWADAPACKRCGKQPQSPEQQHFSQQPPAHTVFAQSPFEQPSFEPQPSWHQPGVASSFGSPYAQNAKKRTGLAVASLIVGIISIFTFGLLLVGAFIGIALGMVALVRVSRDPNVYGGKGLAIGGIATSALSLLMVIPLGIIAAIAVPNLLASRRAANEAYAIRSLRMISSAQNNYFEGMGGGRYGDLDDLTAAGLMEPALMDGEENGYRFVVRASGDYYEAAATPITYRGSGNRSFLFSGGWIHAADKGGLEADTTDPLID